jgi:uncharacterized protein (DUF433 family)
MGDEMDLARLIDCDAEIMGGAACFAGTRVPVKIVLGAFGAGDTLDQLRRAYLFLTQAHLDAAREFASANPQVVARPVRWIPVPGAPKR